MPPKNHDSHFYGLSLGAFPLDGDCCRFTVWAPVPQSIELKLYGPEITIVPLTHTGNGYYEAKIDGVSPGCRYSYILDGDRERPDPASRAQPTGVHEASQVVDPHFEWSDDDWHGIPLQEFITYELHIGTFTKEGTFDSAIDHLPYLSRLGITAIELLPVAQFSGSRNWGYDGVHPFAVQNTYGGLRGLQRLVNEAHRHRIAVIMDVVYNHIGPEGNHLSEFGHYFTPRYRTPWGEAINFDDLHSNEVRRFFIENALFWINECHIDALRLDAIHAIFDITAKPFLQELADAVRLEGEKHAKRTYTIAESSLNDPKVVTAPDANGIGIDAQWLDDFHNSLRRVVGNEPVGYFADFDGFNDLKRSYEDGFILNGRHSAYRGRRHGQPSTNVPPHKFVVYSQNHDQVGNRMLGERLSELVSYEQLKMIAGLVILSPYQPLLFMGEEYGEPARFNYFVSHQDIHLIRAVREGRKQEFARFHWHGDPPDPQAEKTFIASRLNHSLRESGHHQVLFEYYRTLIQLRKTLNLAYSKRDQMSVGMSGTHNILSIDLKNERGCYRLVFNCTDHTVESSHGDTTGGRKLILDSADNRWSHSDDTDSPPDSIRLSRYSVQVWSMSPSPTGL